MSFAPRPARTAFQLSQLGSFAAARFAELVRPLGLTPATAGVLRIVARTPGLSQRALADRLGAVPSRVVVLVDTLESAGYLERSRDVADRRNHRLDLTDAGAAVMAELRTAAQRQNRDILHPLDAQEREQLATLVGKLAAAHALDPEVHRGYGA